MHRALGKSRVSEDGIANCGMGNPAIMAIRTEDIISPPSQRKQ